MQTEQPSQLTGVIIGAAVVVVSSLFTFLGSLLNSWLTGRREVKQWIRQHEAEEAKLVREEQLEEKKQRRLIVQSVLAKLSHLLTMEEAKTTELEAQRSSVVEDALIWLNQLSIQYHTSENSNVRKFNNSLKSFINHPSEYNTATLRDRVTELIMEDKLLFPEGVTVIEPTVPEQKPKEPAVHFAMQVDDNFRREHVIKTGMEVPKIFNFTRPLTQLTQSQRQLLADIYFSNQKEIPKVVNLPLPSPTGPTQVHWHGRINPTDDNHADILKQWEEDYRDAQNKLKKPNGS
jgi:hypothetical protein